jgi:hypothetical protein
MWAVARVSTRAVARVDVGSGARVDAGSGARAVIGGDARADACGGARDGQREADVDDEATHVRVKLIGREREGILTQTQRDARRRRGVLARVLGGERDAHEGARCSAGTGVLSEDRDDDGIWAEDVGKDGLAVTPADEGGGAHAKQRAIIDRRDVRLGLPTSTARLERLKRKKNM